MPDVRSHPHDPPDRLNQSPYEGVHITQAATRFAVIPQSGYTGAEVRGVDLTRELTDDEIHGIRTFGSS